MAEEKKERKIVKVEKTEDGKTIKEAKPVGNAGGLRCGAIICWLVAICFEVLGFLLYFDKIRLPLPTLAGIIGVLVLDLIFVVIGSMLWKKANHIDPASEKNAFKFWVQNNLGTIISVIAFLPIIILVLTDKEMDKKNKTIVSVVAVVLMLVAGVASYDFNPVSVEQLEQAEKEVLATENFDTNEAGEAVVYWAKHSKKYHVDKDCPALKNSDEVFVGTVKAAYEKNLTDPCRRCIHELEETDTQTEEAN